MHNTIERLRKNREERGEHQGGFTLIELLIVIVILGILAAIVVFAVSNLSGSASKSACQTDLKTAETALEAYKSQEGSYPVGTISDMNAALTSTDGSNGPWLQDALATSGGTASYYFTYTGAAGGSSYTLSGSAANCGTVNG